MLAACKGAGLVFVCNPNNPTATVHGIKPITRSSKEVRKLSPDTVILIDEAYHEYVTDPVLRERAAARARDAERLVSRTFSKAYGMAGFASATASASRRR